MQNSRLKFLIFSLGILLFSCQSKLDESTVRQQIIDHGATIRQAFAEGDTALIRLLHHPEVTKALGYNDLKNGRVEVMEGISSTLRYFSLDFVENEVESILIEDNIAIEQTKFAIQGTPKDGGEPFIFKGRTMVTYKRYEASPTGWATIREIIQPATE